MSSITNHTPIERQNKFKSSYPHVFLNTSVSDVLYFDQVCLQIREHNLDPPNICWNYFNDVSDHDGNNS